MNKLRILGYAWGWGMASHEDARECSVHCTAVVTEREDKGDKGYIARCITNDKWLFRIKDSVYRISADHKYLIRVGLYDKDVHIIPELSFRDMDNMMRYVRAIERDNLG